MVSKDVNQSKFNTQFLLYYFLNSGAAELNIEILKIIKMHFPVPLVIKTWSNRFSVEKTKIVDDLYWIVQKGFFIASLGFGGEDGACGKTELNNKLLSSNFVVDSERNPICRGCPEILFDIYKNDKFPINIIDIPNGTDERIKERILSFSNMLIVHSFKEEEETREYLKKLDLKAPTIVLYRDIQDAFQNIMAFKETLTKKLSEALKGEVFEVKVEDYLDYENSNELDYIAEKIHEFILESFKQFREKDKELWKFSEFFENHSKQANEVFDKIREKSSQIVRVIPLFAQIKSQQKKQTSESIENQKELSKTELSLSSELNHVLQLLKSGESFAHRGEVSQLFLEKFQEYLRMMKNQQTMDYYKLYEFKQKFSEQIDNQTITEFANYWEKIQNQEVYYQKMNFDRTTAETKGSEFIQDCIKIFEQHIIPNIFSIELFWRELIYHDSLQKSIGQKSSSEMTNESAASSDFLINLKKDSILKGFPFEVIDGDLLHMPKEFLKNVFKGMKDRVIVISVLGPQSSGKSTLLNFLFGCNFVTSSGRCTKGVYGT